MKGMFSALEIASYISHYYKGKTGKDISPLRLQKTLYFAFAYWGGFMEKSKMQNNGVNEIDLSGYSEYLFDDKIEAWVYGPVVPKVYFEKKLDSYFSPSLFNGKELVKECIDDVIDDTIDVSDFRLVDISHSDKAWKSKFNYDEANHNNEILKDEIIKEYATK